MNKWSIWHETHWWTSHTKGDFSSRVATITLWQISSLKCNISICQTLRKSDTVAMTKYIMTCAMGANVTLLNYYSILSWLQGFPLYSTVLRFRSHVDRFSGWHVLWHSLPGGERFLLTIYHLLLSSSFLWSFSVDCDLTLTVTAELLMQGNFLC